MYKKLSTALLLGSINLGAVANGSCESDAHKTYHHHHKHAHAHTHTTTQMHTTTSHTQTSGHYFKSGFLAGVHTGYVYGHGKFNNDYFLGSKVNYNPDASGSSRVHGSIGLYGIHGGYLHRLHNSFTLGGQVMMTLYSNSKMSTNVNHMRSAVGVNSNFIYRNSVKRDYSLIPSVNFGKVFWQRYHAYVGLGVGISRFEHEVYSIIYDSGAKTHKTKVGFVPALGLDYALDHHFILGAHMSYEIYQNISNTFYSPDISINPGASYTSKIKPRFFNARVGISYKF